EMAPGYVGASSATVLPRSCGSKPGTPNNPCSGGTGARRDFFADALGAAGAAPVDFRAGRLAVAADFFATALVLPAVAAPPRLAPGDGRLEAGLPTLPVASAVLPRAADGVRRVTLVGAFFGLAVAEDLRAVTDLVAAAFRAATPPARFVAAGFFVAVLRAGVFVAAARVALLPPLVFATVSAAFFAGRVLAAFFGVPADEVRPGAFAGERGDADRV